MLRYFASGTELPLDDYGVTNGTLAGGVPYVAVIAPDDDNSLAFSRSFAQVAGLAEPWCSTP